MTTVRLVVPYGGSNPHRERARELVLQHLGGAFPDWPGTLVESQVTPFPKAQLVNQAARDAIEMVLVFNDADSLVPAAQIRQAAELAAARPGLVYGFTHYRRLTEQATRFVQTVEQLQAPGTPPHERDTIFEWSRKLAGSHGCVAVRRDLFLEAGGYDETFAGWGYEDLELTERLGDRWPTRRVAGDLYHLWHGARRRDDSPLDSDPAQVRRNHAAWTRAQALLAQEHGVQPFAGAAG